jgi:hypothetical protein
MILDADALLATLLRLHAALVDANAHSYNSMHVRHLL